MTYLVKFTITLKGVQKAIFINPLQVITCIQEDKLTKIHLTDQTILVDEGLDEVTKTIDAALRAR